jgi:flavin-binding protein dodecin
MGGSTYKIIELVGTSDVSWEDGAKTAVETAGESLKDLRVAEITKREGHLLQGPSGRLLQIPKRLAVSKEPSSKTTPGPDLAPGWAFESEDVLIPANRGQHEQETSSLTLSSGIRG